MIGARSFHWRNLCVWNGNMAQRSLPLVSQWMSRVFSVELDGAPSYFALREQHRGEPAPRAFSVGGLQARGRCYSLLVCARDRIQRARLHGQLKDTLLRDLPAECRLSPMFSFLPRVRGSLVRGYFVTDHSACWASAERVLGDLSRAEEVVVCSYSGDEGSPLTQHLWAPYPAHSYCVIPSEEPESHPAVEDMRNSDIFYNFEEAYSVITECADLIPEARALLEELDHKKPQSRKGEFPVVVVEGLDATGKSTLTQTLRDRLGATLLRSPPQSLSRWRARFDQEPPLIRRAFYALGNYVTAAQMGSAAEKGPVVVDRFWHSTAAYAMATALSGPASNLPPEGSDLYRWPGDLLQPDLVVLLSLDPKERERRLRGRGASKTVEEQELDQNRLFRLRVEEAYRRISGPPCVTVDAAPPPEQVLQQVLLIIEAKCASPAAGAEVPPHTTRGQ